MKIQIDTKEDSHEEIRKVIKMLSSLVGDQEIVSNQGNIFADNSQNNSTENQSADIFGMFNSGGNSGTGTGESSLSNEKKDEKDDEVSIDIEEYL